MRFQILGPVCVADEGGQLKLDGPRLKALLAYLLLHANKPVSTGELLEALWGEEQPRSGATAVQNAVVRLRRTIGDRIVTAGSGYLVRVEAGELDLEAFRDLVARAQPAAPDEKVALLREALALWNGKALDGIEAAAFTAREAAALEDERLTALVSRVDAELELGSNAELVPLLSTLAAEHPLDERFRAQLIVALYRAGRQAAALDVYRETRRLLMDELGLEPGQSLRDLERAVLTQDPSLDYTPPAAPVPVPDRAPADASVPARTRELPRERRAMRRGLVVASSLGALAIAGAALAVALTQKDSIASGSTTIVRISQSTTRSPTTAHVVKAARKARVVHHARSSSAATTTAAPTTTVATVPVQPSTTTQASSVRTTSRPATTPRTTPRTTTRKTPATTTTSATPTTAKTTTTLKATPPAQVYWLSDDFAQPGMDTDLWQTASHGAGVTETEQNDRFELSVGSDVSPDGVYGFDQHYGTQCFLTGDFDATVAYELLDWPAKNGMSVGFGLWRPPPNESFFSIDRLGAAADGGSESYVASGGGYAPTSDTGGMLRLRRKGPWLYMSYRHRDQWVSLGAVRAPGAGQLVLTFFGNEPQFGHQPASVAFDTFDAISDTVQCHGLPLPPRKPRP